MDKIFILENQVKFLEVKYSQAIELLNECKNSLVEFEDYLLAKKIKAYVDVSGLDAERFKIESTKEQTKKEVPTTNFVLNEVTQTYNDYRNHKNELIMKLTIQKIEYGRICIAQLFSPGTPRAECYHKIDDSLKKTIIELGGTPQEMKFFDYL